MPFKKFFKMDKTEVRSLIHLSILIGVIILVPILFEWLFPDKKLEFIDVSPRDSISKDSKIATNLNRLDSSFIFDPNSQDFQIWKKTGLPSFKINMVLHYLAKGGYFKTKEDIQKIYCINHEDYIALLPHVSIPFSSKKSNQNAYPSRIDFRHQGTMSFYKKSFSTRKILDLNLATYQDFMALGIMSSKDVFTIINFRKRNGLFTDIRELLNLNLIDPGTYLRLRKYLILYSPK